MPVIAKNTSAAPTNTPVTACRSRQKMRWRRWPRNETTTPLRPPVQAGRHQQDGPTGRDLDGAARNRAEVLQALQLADRPGHAAALGQRAEHLHPVGSTQTAGVSHRRWSPPARPRHWPRRPGPGRGGVGCGSDQPGRRTATSRLSAVRTGVRLRPSSGEGALHQALQSGHQGQTSDRAATGRRPRVFAVMQCSNDGATRS